MKMQSMIALMLAAALILGCLTGCGAHSSTEQTDSSGTATASLPEADTPARAEDNTETAGTQSDLIPDGTADAPRPGSDADSSTVLGTVTAIDGQNITLLLFPISQGEMGRPGGRGGFGSESRPGNGQNGEMPTPPDASNGEMPAPPDASNGEMPTPSDASNGEMPAPPDGEGIPMDQRPDGQNGMGPHGDSGPWGGFPGEADDITEVSVTLDADIVAKLTVGDLVMVTLDAEGGVTAVKPIDANQAGRPGGMAGMDIHNGRGGWDGQGNPGQNGPGGFDPQGSGGTTGTAANTADTDRDGEAFVSSEADENALKVSGSAVTLTDLTVEKTGDGSNTESCDFYGINAALLAADSAAVTVNGGSFTTDGAGANALFCYGSGTTLTVQNAVIRTHSRNSGGIQTAGGGTTVADNLDIETEGASSAAIRSDRGGGTVTVTGGRYITKGTGSPAIYSTADITVSDAVLTAESSEAVVVEGKNSVTLNHCTVSGDMAGTYGGDSGENLHGVMIYQSMSGDANVGKGSFTMTGGSLTSAQGDLFYVTNTKAEIHLTGVQLNPANDILLRVAGNDGSRGWGSKGSNGGAVTAVFTDQTLMGSIVVDEISSLDLTLQGSSVWTGTVNTDGQAGQVRLTLEAGSTWSLTGDAYLSAFSGDLASVQTNGFHLYVNGEPIDTNS